MAAMKEIYEKAGLFYLGKDVDRESFEPTDVLTLLKSKNFTTHAAIIGMTGSGKTGLGIDILEEAAIDNIPAIVIDPKGDMGDLCLTDPEFRAESFLPWVRDDAEAKGEDPAELAAKTAKMWKEGIESWGQDSERVARFHRVKKRIYTPGSRAGIPVDLMSSLEIPPREILDDPDDLAAYLQSTVTGLLALLDIDADPMESKEYILLAQIIRRAWEAGESPRIETLVGQILNPPFKKIGVLPLESFYPEKDRFKLATRFNSVIASPNFVNWLSGESLEIQKLLYDEEGKAGIAIFSIAHLGDEERMFFVTLLLNKLIAWMRRQSGSNRLKMLLYMDEIYGFFPPVKNPPSKEPMITLLKQARAYGIGIVLSTQNPVDLDYKGLANIGTWCIGRLQTTQDIERVIDGLGGKVGSSFDRKEIARLLANLKKRTFFLKSAHLDDIRLFGTRWVMSYLKGPLKKEEISSLMSGERVASQGEEELRKASKEDGSFHTQAPLLDSSVMQYFETDPSGKNRYRPYLAARASVAFHDQRRGIDREREVDLWLDLTTVDSPDWESADRETEEFERWPSKAPRHAAFRDLPAFVLEDRGLKKSTAALKDHLYRQERLELYRCRRLKMESEPEESESDFRIRVQDRLEDLKDEAIEKLQERYGKQEERLKDQLKRALDRVEKEQTDQTSSLISVGASLLGALFGHTTATKVSTTINRGTRVLKERGDLSRAQERVEEIREKIENLESELEEKIDEISQKYSLDQYPIEQFAIRPRKSDIQIKALAVAWRPEL